MKLTKEQIKSIVVGAVHCWENEEGLCFTKYTPQQLEAWKKAAPGLVANVEASTGIRLDFHTNASEVTFEMSGGKKYELKCNGILTHQFICGEDQNHSSHTVQLGEKGEMKHVVFSLSSHGPASIIRGVTLDDEAIIQPHIFGRKLLFLGDSITQGCNSTFDTLSFAYQVSEALNAESVIHGIGGAFFEPTALCDMGYEADTVLVALGTNDFDRFDRLEEILCRAKDYLQIVKKQFPCAKVYAITPIWREDWNTPRKCGTLQQCRDGIQNVAESLGIKVIDGSKLVPHFSEFMADCVHPNDLGFMQYAKNLLKHIH